MILNHTQRLYVASMGKMLRVTAMFHKDDDANRYMERHKDEAVVACIGVYVFLANVHDKGIKL